MKSEYQKVLQKATSNKEKVEKLFESLSQEPSKSLDEQFHNLHEQAFEKIDCLQCANCCKTTSPIFEQTDIDRVAKHLKISTGTFIQAYLHMDEDGDFVLNSSPCSFLNTDNTCKVYDARPKACSEYPHTNRKRMNEILDITFENTLICPAVSDIVSKIKLGRR